MPEEKVSSSVFAVVVTLAGLVGFILGYLMARRESSTAITTFSRDDKGHILEIMEKFK